MSTPSQSTAKSGLGRKLPGSQDLVRDGMLGQQEGEACSIRGFNRVGVGVLRSGPPEEEGRKKAGKDRVCPMAPDVAHVMWSVAGMGAAKAGCAMQLGRISQSLGGGWSRTPEEFGSANQTG